MDPDMADDFKRLVEPLKMYLFRDETDSEIDNDAVEVCVACMLSIKLGLTDRSAAHGSNLATCFSQRL